jgi:UDP-2-acetamido-3-amino-2,3-dideoxy-glucuronate N-acetyltransferase
MSHQHLFKMRGTLLGKTYIHPTAIVDKKAKIGEGTKIWHFVHIRENAKIGKNCVLGHAVYVDRNVKIGNCVKLENRVNLYDGVTIEDDVFIGPHVTFANDLYPRSFSTDWKIVPTLVKKGASIGAGSVVVCGVTLGEYAMVGAGSVVTRNVPAHALVFGNPARIRGFVCVCGRNLIEEKKQAKSVLMTCASCGKKSKIPRDDFEKVWKGESV